jgi:hypothetical protein
MIKVYLPVKKNKFKTQVRGLWRNDKGELYYDYITQVKIEKSDLQGLKDRLRQERIFYTEGVKGFIWYNQNRIDTFKWYEFIAYDKTFRGLKDKIKELLKRYGGLTIYIKDNQYLIEIHKGANIK